MIKCLSLSNEPYDFSNKFLQRLSVIAYITLSKSFAEQNWAICMSTKLNRKVILKPDLCKLISSPLTSTFGSTLPLHYTLNVWRCSLKSEYCVMKIQGRHLNHHLHVVIFFANRNHMKIILYHHYINILIFPFNNHL